MISNSCLHLYQDSDTASAIGWKSYNTLMGELVALDTEIWESDLMNSDDDCVDFAAATTASLGIPSPSLTRNIYFDDSPFHHSVSEEKKERRGDREEEEELLRALKQSEAEISAPTDDSYLKQQEPAIPMEVHTGAESDESCPQKSSIVDDNKTLNDDGNDLTTFETASRQDACSSSKCENDKRHEQMQAVSEKHEGKDEIEKASIDALVKSETTMEDSDTSNAVPPVNTTVPNSGDENIQDQPAQSNDLNIVRNVDALGEMSDISYPSASPIEELESFKDLVQHINESKCSTSSADGSEPIYEGEEYVQETSSTNYEDQEPMYEGEMVLAEQVDKLSSHADETKDKSGITRRQGRSLSIVNCFL